MGTLMPMFGLRPPALSGAQRKFKKGRNNEVSTLFDSGPALEEAALVEVIKPHDELGTIGAYNSLPAT